MKIDVRAALKSPGEAFDFRFEENWGPLEGENEQLHFTQPVTLEGVYTSFDNNVAFRGRLLTKLTASCARCLDPVEFKVDVQFEEVFYKEADPEHADDRFCQGDMAQLDEAVEEAIRLSFPIRFLCGPRCKGLCPECGCNLNQLTCTHAAQVLDEHQ